MPVSIYHCLCSELVLATTIPLQTLPKRQNHHNTLICKLATTPETLTQGSSILHDTVKTEAQPLILKLDDGFEKRYPVECSRCGLMMGYQLDLSQFEETKSQVGRRKDVVYVVSGGLIETGELERGAKVEEKDVLVEVKG